MTVVEMKRLTMEKLKKLVLKNGNHKDRSNGLCVMEAAAWFAGEPHSDSPMCVDPAITSFLQYVNDNAPEDQRQQLKSVVKEIVGTRTDNVEIIHKRIFIVTDFAVRFAAPLALEAAKLDREAAALRALPPIDSRAAARAAIDAAGAASDVAWAAWAASDAARAASDAARAASDAAGVASDAAGVASDVAGVASDVAWAAWAASDVAWAAWAASDVARAASDAAGVASDAAGVAMWNKLMPEILRTVRAMVAAR
jgi:hypothetical protein